MTTPIRDIPVPGIPTLGARGVVRWFPPEVVVSTKKSNFFEPISTYSNARQAKAFGAVVCFWTDLWCVLLLPSQPAPSDVETLGPDAVPARGRRSALRVHHRAPGAARQ